MSWRCSEQLTGGIECGSGKQSIGAITDVQNPINNASDETINLGSQNEERGIEVNKGESNVVKETQMGLQGSLT